MKLQPQTLGIHYSQTKHPLANRLAAPSPFTKDGVADTDDEISNQVKRAGKVSANQLEQRQKEAEQNKDRHDANQVHKPGTETRNRAGKKLGENDALGSADLERGSFHQW